MTGQSTSYSGYGQAVPSGYMAMIFLDISVKFIIQKVDWDKQVDQVFLEELANLVEG